MQIFRQGNNAEAHDTAQRVFHAASPGLGARPLVVAAAGCSVFQLKYEWSPSFLHCQSATAVLFVARTGRWRLKGDIPGLDQLRNGEERAE